MEKPVSLRDKGNVLKVIELGVENRVYDAMKKPRFSVEALTRELNTEGIHITAQSIRKFIKKTKKAQQELISRDINAATEYKKLAMDYSKEIKNILEEVKEVKDEARTNRDMATYNQLVGRLMQGLELIAKLTGDIKPKGSVDVTLIYNEINEDIEKKMSKMKHALFREAAIDVDFEIVNEDKEMEKRVQAGE